MAIPILNHWPEYFGKCRHEGLGSSYERIVLNKKLLAIKDSIGVESCLEAPAFGFTGISGINSMVMAQQGVAVALVDHDKDRLRLIREVWDQVGLPVALHCTDHYCTLPFERKSFDLSWNFSALWFVADLDRFLDELIRVTRKAILLCVPNLYGMGYISQKYFSTKRLRSLLKEEHIVARRFIEKLKLREWSLVDHNYIDAPPWPDIGMKKEDLFGKWGRRRKTQQPKELCILNYYTGKEPGFENEMLRHFWFEKYAPNIIKMFWAHHRYFLFEPPLNQSSW